MNPKNKRILWICNHATLMDVECKLLCKLGFEVYVPKILGKQRSSAQNFQYDKTLSISEADIQTLNAFNFYEDKWSDSIRDLINQNFALALCVNVYPAIFNLVKNFAGKIVLRAFGYEADIKYEQTTCCTPKIRGVSHLFKPKEIMCDNQMMRALYKIKNRFYLGVGYREIIDNETPFFLPRCVYLPLGIPSSIWEKENTYTGDLKKVMFVCPSIDNAYYGKIYHNFKNNFNDLPHLIFGSQAKEYPEDKSIVGFLPRKDFDEYLTKCAVMFYHSQEKRHLHYHPLEAIVYGMPLVFMAGGLLEKFGGSNQPGMAQNTDEAKQKLLRVLNGDKPFISSILSEQKKMLNEFKDDYVFDAWRQNFLPLTLENEK